MIKYVTITFLMLFMSIHAFAKESKMIDYINGNDISDSLIHQIDSIITNDISGYEISDADKIPYYDVDIIIYQNEDTIIRNPDKVNLSKINHYQIYVKGIDVPENRNYVIEYNSRKYTFRTDIFNDLCEINQIGKMLAESNSDYRQSPNWLFIFHNGTITGKVYSFGETVFYNQYN